ncbi:MAG: CoA transferase [Gammaproteobacteria bacterium]|jgi:CoA:oxalate CoA-transferase|nr:CoA transferase [Gammaproteobacteria bacterium]MBT5205421.1 CoA transferase [Gammaproteobacteria bacterium]MBT5601299.1 CoA transferase [Gammaproteobacteria bacterium]MBT6244974.1 CoA transferase [Gammaproteobacteria bacterium]
MQEQPLSDITVLDFGQVYNGPYCGFLLAQAGARVIKVESLIGETLRSRGVKSTASYPFAVLNVNKESITLNIKSTQGQALLKKLVSQVDVVLENFAPGTMARYGIGAKQLRACNPQLIYASSTGYGNAPGPYRDFLGMDITLQAMTGVMSITGEENSTPLKTAAAFADFIAGTHLYAGIVSALYARKNSSEGASVDISMQDCVLPTLATALGSYYLHGEPPKRAGNRHPGRSLAPYNVYVAADGHIAIIAIREGHWRKLCTAMEKTDLINDPRFKDFPARCKNMQELDAEITRWTATRTRAEILAQTQAHGVICAPVQDLIDVVNDPHLAARGTLKTSSHKHLGNIAQMQTAIRFTDIEPPELTQPPELGANTRLVLTELAGLSNEDIDRLYQQEAI